MINIAKKAAIEAGEILTKKFGKIRDAHYKGKGIKSIVSSADLQSEALIIKILKKEFKNHSFLAEERGHVLKNPDHTWIIDPLDGSSNYVQGIPHFAVSIAHVHKDTTLCGVIYDPIKKELFWSEKEKGAYLNGKKIHVSEIKKLEEAFANVGWTSKGEKEALPCFAELGSLTRKIRALGSAALDYCYLASGRYDLIISHKMNFWDIAAGCLIAEEAGAIITDEKGQKIVLSKPFNKIIASNKYLHPILLKKLRPQ